MAARGGYHPQSRRLRQSRRPGRTLDMRDAKQSLISRRGFLRAISAAGGLAAIGALAACGVPTATPPTPAPAKPIEAPKPAAPAAPAPAPAAAASPAAAQAAPPQVVGSGFNWQRFKGETVRMIWQSTDQPQVAGLVPFFPEFEQLTGM